ncbi:TolC family outer membrane protein [Rhodoferax sp. UBA5149]|uniref:TolC family outer membrane protein n=1 Tax=Rhodoferax sp. UBA5149 TaxID=1947379 RepID=UPI0025EE77F0|nr:TolC family outer membrane protein [Rhodoferax sp. UBA5149]
MILKPYLFIFAAFGIAFFPAFAQTPSTLKDAVERAVLQNPEVKLKFQNLEAVRGEQDAAKGAWRPRIDVEAATGPKSTLTPALPSATTYTGSTASIQLRQTLFDGYATASEVRRLGHSRQVAYYELLSTSEQTALETARAYLDVQLYRETLALARDNYATHADLYQRIGSRVSAGVGRRVDLEQASGRMALAESNWLTEASNLHDVSARYQRLTGEVPGQNLEPTPSLDKFLPARARLLSDAIANNPEFLGAVSTIRAYRADADVRRASNWPTIELRASQSLERNQNGILGNYRDSALQLVLNYNLYRGGSDSARITQYVAKLNAAYELRDKACRDIRQTAQIAYNDVGRLGQQIIFLGQHELSTSKAHEAYRQQFDIGQRSLLDLLDTENELFQARIALVKAEFDLRLAKIRVLASSGALLSALQLRPIENEAPPAPGGNGDDDGLLRCSTELPAVTVLDKANLPKVEVVQAIEPSPAPRATPAPSAPPGGDCQKVTTAVEDWAGAWNRKDIEAYLGAYSDTFVPAMGMSHAAWETLRKKRVANKQGDLKAVLRNVRTLRCEANAAEVAFTQGYDSVDYKDVVEKTLTFEFTQGAWRITRETVTKGRTY